MPINSIRARMTATFSAAIALLMLLTCAGLNFNAHRTAEHNADTLLNSAAQKVRRELTNGEQHVELAELIEEERDLASQNLTLMIVNDQGQIAKKSQHKVPPWPHSGRDGWRIVTVPYGRNTVVIGLPWKGMEASLKAQALGLLALSIVVITFVTFGAWLLVGRTLSPIGQLMQQARAASVQNLRVHLNAPSEDVEIVGLVDTLNELLERLTESADARGRFYAAASHELRTPLQALAGHLELALTRKRTADDYQERLQVAYGQTKRLMSLVRALLTLNQVETAPLPPAEPVNVADVCERALFHFARLAEEKGICIATELSEEAVVYAAPSHVEMLVSNLVENSIKYASPQGEVRLRLDVCDTGVSLEIFNECGAPADWDGQKIYEPFYRPDASRNSKTGGNGLGLAICKAISNANHWPLSLTPNNRGVLGRVVFARSTAQFASSPASFE